MPHVTFVHGISNKPPADELSRIWRGVLADHGLDLDAHGVSSSMMYWADLLYPEPLHEQDYESAGDIELVGSPDVGMRWIVEASGEEAEFVKGLAKRIGYDELASDDPALTIEPVPEGRGFERVPLPWLVKQRMMKILLRDVHHYLFDAEFSPRPGATYRIQRDVRARALDALRHGAEQPGPHVVMAHSLGSVIAYDCLKRVDGCPAVDGLLTIGSPLGIDEVQDRLRPEWSRVQGFPSERVRRRWVNVYDRLDPVAGFDPALANDYRHNGERMVEDVHEPNWGRWRHSISKYLAKPRLREKLTQLLGLDDSQRA
jgi:predicted alpha/beta hydrolase family esterase